MRCLSLVAAALLLLGAPCAHADTTDDLRRPSSTVPGCANDWGPLGVGSGWVEPTCEAKAALAEWDAHAAAVNLARATLVGASDLPAERTDPRTVAGALDAAAAAVDAMARLYDPAAPQWGDFADVLAWMRPWFERQRLPLPGSIGDGLRTLASAVAQPYLLLADRATLYGQAAVFATRATQLAAELRGTVQRQHDAAVQRARPHWPENPG